MIQRTLAIIKPDAVARGKIGAILQTIEESELRLVALKMVHLGKAQAEGFYLVHRERPFFDALTSFMSEGPAVVLVLEGEEAIATWRRMMGATDPAKAEEGTIRRRFAENIERNCVHGSDAPDTAAFELSYFFSGLEAPAR
jgi:nucleoside-diphosphate kinase